MPIASERLEVKSFAATMLPNADRAKPAFRGLWLSRSPPQTSVVARRKSMSTAAAASRADGAGASRVRGGFETTHRYGQGVEPMVGMQNVRDAYGFDPYGTDGAGGLLGMLQAIVQQGHGQMVPDWGARNPESGTPIARQTSDFGANPATHITVRPTDAHYPSDATAVGGNGGLLGRLLALQAARQQPRPVDRVRPTMPPAPLDPNFRQLSRVVPAAQLLADHRDDQSRPIGDDIPLDASRTPNAARPAPVTAGFLRFGAGPMPFTGPTVPPPSGVPQLPMPTIPEWWKAIGTIAQLYPSIASGMGDGGQAPAGVTTPFGGATILNSRKKDPPGDDGKDGNRTDPKWGDPGWLEWFKGNMADAKRAREEASKKKWAGKLNDPGDICTEQQEKDIKDCHERWDEMTHPDFLRSCIAEAGERLSDCYKYGGGPVPNKVRKWSPEWEDINYEHGRKRGPKRN